MQQPPKWIKSKGYIHLTPSLNIQSNWQKYLQQIKNPNFVARYAFYPLMHRNIKNRRYKKPNPNKHLPQKRAHRHFNKETGKTERSTKVRPLHYASHFDFLIYSYYADILKKRYEKTLKKDPLLDKAILAYRSIPVSETEQQGKSNIHFAKETFEEIEQHFKEYGKTAVLTLDLKSFFSSLAHDYLYKSWCRLLETDRLPLDHLNVFKASTRFSYVLYEDLRKGKNNSFDEAHLAEIRKKHGFKAFFSSNEELRKNIKEGSLPIFKNPFRGERNKGKKEVIGIPQGLPLSAVLSNVYLLEFDQAIINKWVRSKKIIYRRYSDDILIICSPDKMDVIYKEVAELIKHYKVELSPEKTERFLFQNRIFNKAGDRRLTSIEIKEDSCTIGSPLTYLGFEYRGYNTLIKSSNLAKYYRRMIQLIKRRAKRAKRLSEKNPTVPRAVYINQIKKLYNAPLKNIKEKENNQLFRRRYQLVVNDRGDFEFNFTEAKQRHSNYITYIRRCDKVFGTTAFSQQLRKKKQIIGQAINKHL